MSQQQDIKIFAKGGMNQNDAYETIDANDYIEAYNLRNGGTSESEENYETNLESTIQISLAELSGINKGIGGRAFENTRQIVFFRYNSFGNNQICVYDYDTDSAKVIYTDKTDSAGATLLPLDPKNIVKCILINDTYLVWADGDGEVGYTNLKTLSSGGYGVVLAEDLSLIKPQPLVPITGVYASDGGKASNFVRGKLFQFTYQWVNTDFNYSTWATWSKRISPLQESTPTVGTDVSSNNCIVVSVPIGSIRASQLNVACRFGTNIYNTIKTVDRAYILALTDTAVDVALNIYEGYNPSTGIYQFVFYNDSLTIAVPPTETDQFVDYIWPSTGIEKINGNIIALGDLHVGYDRPTTPVTLNVTGYDPGLTIPIPTTATNPLRIYQVYGDRPLSGHTTLISLSYTGIPHTGDVLSITLYDKRNASITTTYTYTVPSSQDGNLVPVLLSFAGTLPDSNVVDISGSNTILKLSFRGFAYSNLQSVSVTLFNGGPTVSKSIHGVLDNSSYQLALSHRDRFGRPFPLQTGNTFIAPTPSFAQLNGLTPQIAWSIDTPTAPAGAADYQWLITKNTTTTNILDVFGCVLNYLGSWDAHANTPALTPNQGGKKVGDTYQITTPTISTDNRNLGNGQQEFKTGDYIVYNGKSWDVVDKLFGDLTSSGDIIAIKINPLSLFNQRYSNNGFDTVLSYDYAVGDRCTLHYYSDPSTPTVKTYLNNPCVDVDVFGYDSATSLLKVQKSASITTATLIGKDIYLRLHTPNTQQAGSDVVAENTTVWYEIGERFTITNGLYDTLQGTITDGDVYFKTRGYQGSIDPSVQYNVVATDFNFSDFYPSRYTSYGRPRAYYDILEKTRQQASIIYSQNYILGSRKNGLNRFFQENIYGDGDGQTSSSFGAIQILWQRNETLVVIQELNTGYIPVNRSILEDLNNQQQYAISEKLLNPITYNQTGNFGIGTARESFCYNNSTGYFVDPHKNEPMAITLQGIVPISGKMSKYFKSAIQLAYSVGKKLAMFYNVFYDELSLCIQDDGGILTLFKFSSTDWQAFDDYTIVGTDVTSTSTPTNTTRSYNSSTGLITYTPNPSFVGNTVGTFTFNTAGGAVTKNVCLNWTAGSSVVNSFFFTDQIDEPLSTYIVSNSILVSGNTIPAAISITGGQYSINGGAYTASAGTVNQFDSVTVRVMSSSLVNTATSTTLTIGGVSDTFTVRTLHSASVNIYVAEQANPYSDANVEYKVNGVEVARLTGSGTTNFTPIAGSLLSFEAFSERPATGSSPTKSLKVDKTIGGVTTTVYPYTTNSNNPGDPSLIYNTTAEADALYEVYESANAVPFAPDATGILVVDIFDQPTLNAVGFVDTAATVPYQLPAYTGLNFVPNDGTPAQNCWVLASDQQAGSAPKWRWEFNIAQLMSLYPAQTSFVFKIKGRAGSVGTVSGQYNLKGADAGNMTMGGTAGTYIPSTSGATNIGMVTFSAKPVVGGADGTYGVGIGADILTFTYSVSAKTITLT